MKARLQLEEHTFWNDLVISIVLCLIPFGIWALYQIAPEATVVLALGVPTVIVFARWLKLWTARELSNLPAPFDEEEE